MLLFIKIALVNSNIILFLFLSNIQQQQSGAAEAEEVPFNFNRDDNARNEKSKEVFKYMNLTADPCHDFYEFACGNWLNYHMPSRQNEVITPASILEEKVSRNLQNMLKEGILVDDGINGRKVKDFYKSCLDIEKNGKLQQAFFSEFIKNNSGFPAVPGAKWLMHNPNYNWQEVVAQLRYRYGMDILIGLKIDLNHLNSDENSIYLVEPSTFIPAELCNVEAVKHIDMTEPEYEIIEKEVADNLRMWLSLSMDEARNYAVDIVKFESELCGGMKGDDTMIADNQSIAYLRYARKTLYEFTHHFNDSIDFNRFVTTSFGAPFYKPAFMPAEPYYKQLIKTISKSNTTTIANYIMYRALSLLSFPHDDHPTNRAAHCLKIMKRYFPKVIGGMYFYQYANTAAKNETALMYDKIKYAFRGSLGQSWLEDGTSRAGKAKLDEIKLNFPTYERMHLSNLQIDRADYWHNLAQLMIQVQLQQLARAFETEQPRPIDEIEAYETRMKYRKQHKRIDMGWALLPDPLLYPTSMRYAMIGQQLARKLASAFDDLSWTADNIALGGTNWDRQTAVEYRDRSECFRRQISNYLHNQPDVFQNVTRLREVIAASAGLNIAFTAYLNWLDFLNPNNDFAILARETLPELNFTNTQLFFITYAQMLCRADKKNKPAPIFNPLSVHTLERYEINGPLKNFIEFARDFRCPAGAEMNPADKCVIY